MSEEEINDLSEMGREDLSEYACGKLGTLEYVLDKVKEGK